MSRPSARYLEDRVRLLEEELEAVTEENRILREQIQFLGYNEDGCLEIESLTAYTFVSRGKAPSRLRF